MNQLSRRSLAVVLLALTLLLLIAGTTSFKGLNREDLSLINPLEGPYGTALNHATLSAALTSMGASPKTLLVPPGTWTIGADLTIPANVHLQMPAGAVFSVSSGRRLTINSLHVTLPTRHVFTGAGHVGWNSPVPINAYWFGAALNGTSDDAPALNRINTALPTTGGSVYIPSSANGLRLTSTQWIITKPTRVFGDGYGSWIRWQGTDFGPRVRSDHVTFEKLRFGPDPSSFGEGINVGDIGVVRHIKFIGNTFVNLAQCIWLMNAESVLVEANNFTGVSYGIIAHFQAGMVTHNVTITGNTFQGTFGYAVNNNTRWDQVSTGWVISNNVYIGGGFYPTPRIDQGFVSLTATRGAIVSHNTVIRANYHAINIESTTENVIIEGNYFEDITGDAYALIIQYESGGAFGCVACIGSISFKNSQFVCTGAHSCASFMIRAFDTPVHLRVHIKGNEFIDERGGTASTIKAIAAQNAGYWDVDNNLFRGVSVGIDYDLMNTSQAIRSNTFESVGHGFVTAFSNTSAGGGIRRMLFANNLFRFTVQHDVLVKRNTNNTNPSEAWAVTSNIWSKDPHFYDHTNMNFLGNVPPTSGTAVYCGTWTTAPTNCKVDLVVQ